LEPGSKPLRPRLLSFSMSSQHPAKLSQDFSGPRDLRTRLLDDFRRQWLVTPIPDFQHALNRTEMVSGGGQALG